MKPCFYASQIKHLYYSNRVVLCNTFMPSGRTHDRITLWCLPFVTGCTYLLTNSLAITVILTLSFLVGGFMLGPDLDIRSIQYRRWGLLRWIWLPYQKALKHRSRLSHGPIIGTAIRVVYMGVWLAIFTTITAIVFNALWDAQLTWQSLSATVRYLANHYLVEWVSAIIGLELGAISHSTSDMVGSRIGKRRSLKRKGLKRKKPSVKKRKKKRRWGRRR